MSYGSHWVIYSASADLPWLSNWEVNVEWVTRVITTNRDVNKPSWPETAKTPLNWLKFCQLSSSLTPGLLIMVLYNMICKQTNTCIYTFFYWSYLYPLENNNFFMQQHKFNAFNLKLRHIKSKKKNTQSGPVTWEMRIFLTKKPC